MCGSRRANGASMSWSRRSDRSGRMVSRLVMHHLDRDLSVKQVRSTFPQFRYRQILGTGTSPCECVRPR